MANRSRGMTQMNVDIPIALNAKFRAVLKSRGEGISAAVIRAVTREIELLEAELAAKRAAGESSGSSAERLSA